GVGVDVDLEGRVSLFGDNENIIGIRMVVSSLFLSHLILKNGGRRFSFLKIFLFLSYIPLLTLLLSTGSRLSFISLIIGMSLIIFLYKTKSTFTKGLVLILGLACIFYVFQLALQSEVLGSRLSKTVEDGN